MAHSKTIDLPPSATAFCVSSIVRTAGCQMIGSAAASGSLVPERARMDLRSLQYHSEFWKAACGGGRGGVTADLCALVRICVCICVRA